MLIVAANIIAGAGIISENAASNIIRRCRQRAAELAEIAKCVVLLPKAIASNQKLWPKTYQSKLIIYAIAGDASRIVSAMLLTYEVRW